MNSESPEQQAWMRFASLTAKKVNVGWWLQCLILPLTLLAILSSAGIMVARYYEVLPDFPITLPVLGGALALLAVFCWLFARGHFEKPVQSLVRIEATMKLRNALSSAHAGVTPWPAALEEVDAGVNWKWGRILIPALCSIGLIAGSFFIPMGAYAQDQLPNEQPKSLTDLENAIEQLEDNQDTEEAYIEEMEKHIEQLKEQNQEDWFSHSSLEAIDTLRETHTSNASSLERDLRQAERSLQSLQKHGDKMKQATKNRLLDEFDAAMNGMNQGAMKPNKELLDQLNKLDPKQLNNLTQEQLDQLRQNMRKHAENLKQNCESCQGGGGGGDWEEELMENPGGNEQGDGDGQPRPGPGNGGINRGPGHAPGVLGDMKEKLNTGDMKAIEPKDLSNSLPGDLLQTIDGEHDIARDTVGPREGGATNSNNEGGERVWKNSLLPHEKKALKKFFK